MGGSRDFIGVGSFAVNVNLRKGGTEVMSLVAAFDLPLSRLFRGHHDPAGACERTDRSQVTTLMDVLSHAIPFKTQNPHSLPGETGDSGYDSLHLLSSSNKGQFAYG